MKKRREREMQGKRARVQENMKKEKGRSVRQQKSSSRGRCFRMILFFEFFLGFFEFSGVNKRNGTSL